MFHAMLASEFKTWTPDQISRLTPTQLMVLGQPKPPEPTAITTAEGYQAMLDARERERAHWEH
jgi:hypothetical protein